LNVAEPLLPVAEPVATVAPPLLVTAEVAIGLVVVQDRVVLKQEEAPDAMVHDEEFGFKSPVICVKEATTVQFAVTGEVV
jgi:hypothetical protein